MTKRIIMIDIETLDTGHTAIAWQIGMVGVMADDPNEKLEPSVSTYLPIVPQQQLIPPRTIGGLTAIYWLTQPDEARTRIAQCDSIDFNELIALMRHFIRAFNRMTDNGTADYEVVTRGNFDLPILESLIKQCGLEVPWHFRNCSDLRTLMRYAGVDVKDIPEPTGFVKHDAYWDCVFQLACYFESVKKIAA